MALLALLTTTAVAVTHHVPAGYATIQAAVDAAAPGDTVAVAAGSYSEQVVIPIDLVLRGAGREQTVITSPMILSYALGLNEYRGVVVVDQTASEVTVADLAIDGLGRQLAAGRFVGLLYYRAGGAVTGVEIRNLHHDPVSGAQSGIGLLASLDSQTTPTDFAVTDVVIRSFQKAGLVISGAGYDVNLVGVEIDPETVITEAVQIGIELSRVDTARLADCRISNVIYNGAPRPEFTACGLLANVCNDLEVRDCSFDGCQAAMYLVRTPALVCRTNVTTPQPGLTIGHGVVSVGAINPSAAGSGPDEIPVPRPLLGGSFQPTRPPVGFDVCVRDCDLGGDGRPNTRGMAFRAYTAEAQWFTAERCHLHDWEVGVLSLEDELEFGAAYGRLSGCRITGNLDHGIRAVAVTPLDARGCLWADATGPYHADLNPGGQGDLVSDLVRFDPWLMGNLAPLPLPQAISLSDFDGFAYTDSVTIEYLGGADELLYGYSVEISWDPAVVQSVVVERPTRGEFADAEIFQILPLAAGVTIDAALGGDRDGIASGPLCTIRFAAIGTPDWTLSPLTLVIHQARDRQNQNVGGLVTDTGQITVDLQPPVISSVTLVNETLPHTDEFAKDGDLVSVTAAITDGDPNFGRGSVRGIGAFIFGAPSLILPPDQFQDGVASWNPRPVLISPNPDGLQLFSVEAIDLSGNATSPLVSDSLIADNTPPSPLTGLIVTADHNQIDLVWNDGSGSDLNYRHMVARANRWYGYPEYAGDEPEYPASLDIGEEIYAGSGTATQMAFAADGSERDIYYLAVMAEDMAGNLGLLDENSRARTVNYRLGDVRGTAPASPGNGTIDIFDITSLGDTYLLLQGEGGFDATCDLAPLDGGATGVPVPDGEVDFVDLMIFSTNFYLDRPPPPDPGKSPPDLRWVRVAPSIWALVLAEPCPRLKGLHLSGENAGANLRLETGALLAAQDGPWFLHQGRGGCDVHLAVLGRGVGLAGSGELLRLVADQPVLLPVPEIELRDVDNREILFDLSGAGVDEPALPSVFRAGLPHPNPFNPSTTIAFDLPASQSVQLLIYGLDGRRVSRVLAAVLPAGRHTARWDGRDHTGRPVASGTYLSRLEAGPWSATGKLELIT